ncbi:glycosyltransferase [Halomonas sp. LR5S13]|uniref:glycosyltransferase n=1 Tax=Halomonas rhizosphaerae TaxID=3043296 RepID=UPI0024A937F2|nr:glycosyltransferase [Halomonas rhizosphaerae]MDI5920858.1 glycosyltransferase [Halomonas rhizosphaerae]
MKIGLMIGRLGQGGAERQLAELAIGLARQGHTVEVLCYRGPSEMDRQLEAQGVTVRSTPARGRWGHVALARHWLDDFSPQIVHAFMKRASCVAALARPWRTELRLIASDYSTASYGRRKPSLWVSLCLFGLADRVVTETQMNRHHLESLAPWLIGKVNVIRNGLDLSRYRPPVIRRILKPTSSEHMLAPRDDNGQDASKESMESLHFCAVGSVYEVKNPVRVVEAVSILHRRRGDVFHLDWYGRLGLKGDGSPSQAYHDAMRLADALGVRHLVTFHGTTTDVDEALREADVFLHASLQEGFPNALVEAMATGLPVLVSRVSDLPLVVEQAENGRDFDEKDPVSIAEAMEWMLDLSDIERWQRGERSRDLACAWFGKQRFIDDHLEMYTQLTGTGHGN